MLQANAPLITFSPASAIIVCVIAGAQQNDNHHLDSLKSWSYRSIVGPLAEKFFRLSIEFGKYKNRSAT
jgi:hypothetical protein